MQTKPAPEVDFRRHIPALDGVRGIAALSVVLFHYGGGTQSSFAPLHLMGVVLHFGWLGVSLFFALSGFLISGILWDGYHKPGWWKRFYIRRSLRIFPLYYLAIAIAAVVYLCIGIPASHLIIDLWSYVLYLRDLPYFVGQLPPQPVRVELIHFWSLAVEEQFYLIWPFLLALFAGKRLGAKRMILILWVLSLAFRAAAVAMHSPEWGSYFLFGRAGELLAGAYLALSIRGSAEERVRLFQRLPYVFGVGLAILIVLGILFPDGDSSSGWWCIAGLALSSIVFASMIGLVLRKGILQSFFDLPVLRWLGKISYGVYVYHLFLHWEFLWITDHIAPGLDRNARLALLFVVAMTGTLAAASLSFYTYERAFLKLKDRIAH
ncbi:MAG TPA: acyltransferase [Acidobacteriaceae bacterium]|nr:acyltransferase [Acidobacteriaceae bacterium]